jgi:hypothetical protein
LTQAAKSILVFGIYLAAVGAAVILAPNFLLQLLGLPGTNEVWIRVVGVLTLFLAFFFIQAARHAVTEFFRWTVYVRSAFIFFLAAFVLFGLAGPTLILFGVIDLLGAIWTELALRSAGNGR